MYTIKDSMFALILRFVGRTEKITFSDQQFIRKQLKIIQKYIDQFPPEEQELRAMRWIEKYARRYRKVWERDAITKEFSDQRCRDCPLSGGDLYVPCPIHDQWLKLFQQYTEDQISSTEYVKNTLELLARHKKDLKVKLSRIKRKPRPK